MVTLSLARDLPSCMLRCTAGGLLGWVGQCEVMGGGDRGAAMLPAKGRLCPDPPCPLLVARSGRGSVTLRPFFRQ